MFLCRKIFFINFKYNSNRSLSFPKYHPLKNLNSIYWLYNDDSMTIMYSYIADKTVSFFFHRKDILQLELASELFIH